MKYLALLSAAAFILSLGACAKKDDTSSTMHSHSSSTTGMAK